MAYANGDGQQPEPIIIERGGGESTVWPQPTPQPQPEK